MLRIRSDQIRALESATLHRFKADLAAWVRLQYPEATAHLDTTGLASWIDREISHAASYGLDSAADIAGFVALTLTLRPGFDRIPGFHAVLTDPAIEPGSKLDALLTQVTPEDWAAAGRST